MWPEGGGSWWRTRVCAVLSISCLCKRDDPQQRHTAERSGRAKEMAGEAGPEGAVRGRERAVRAA